MRKAFRGAEFLYTLRLATGETVMALVPSHHDHSLGEWIGIRAEVDHVVTFNRDCPQHDGRMCRMPCEHTARPADLVQPVQWHAAQRSSADATIDTLRPVPLR
jgi:iron(III) transport system ATP-binding protein